MPNLNPSNSPESILGPEIERSKHKFERILIFVFSFPFLLLLINSLSDLISHRTLIKSHWLFDFQFVFIGVYCMIVIPIIGYYKYETYYNTNIIRFIIITLIRGLIITLILDSSKSIAALFSWLLWPIFGDGAKWTFSELIRASNKDIQSHILSKFIIIIILIFIVSGIFRLYGKNIYKIKGATNHA